jgi:hypothetical protein
VKSLVGGIVGRAALDIGEEAIRFGNAAKHVDRIRLFGAAIRVVA